MQSITKKQLRRRNRYFEHRSFSDYSRKEKIIMAIVFVIFLAYAISLLYPFFYLLVNSFKTTKEFAGWFDPVTETLHEANPFGFAMMPTFDNFIKACSGLSVGSTTSNIGLMYLNTITLSVGQTIVSMAMTCCAAYVLAKYKFRGNKIIFTIVLISSFVPTIAAFPATFRLMYQTGLNGTYFGMIFLTAAAFGGAFLYIHSYFKAIPWTFAESAMMDGASDFRVFWQIMMPLARNGILTFTIIKFLGYWNDYWLPSVFYKNNPTLAVGISVLSGSQTEDVVIFAAMVLAVLPVLIFYALFEKKLTINTIGGGIKG